MRFFATNHTSWHFRTNPDGGVGFCIWALQQDGLHVPPFNHHPAGNSSLRAAGLTSDGWWEWCQAVVALNRRMDEFAADRVSPTREIVMPAHFSYQAWHGEPAVASVLEAMWKPYETATDIHRNRYIGVTAPWHLAPRDYRRWWKQLTAIRGTLPPLSIFLAHYPATVVYPSRPATLVIGTDLARLDGVTYGSLVLQGTAQLATAKPTGAP